MTDYNAMQKIMENAVLIRVAFGGPGETRQGSLAGVETDFDKSRARLDLKLYDCAEYSRIAKSDTQARANVAGRLAISVDLGFPGVYVCPLAMLDRIEQELTDYRDRVRPQLIAAFGTVYEAQRDEARRRLNGQFREEWFPAWDVVRAKFRFTWRYVTFKTPDTLPPEILAREQEALEKQFSDMAADVREALRAGLRDLVAHLADVLTNKAENGKPKIFRDTTVSNLVDFLDLFEARDVTQDEDLRQMVRTARRIIGDATPQDLRDRVDLRQAVGLGMAQVAAAVDGLIGAERGRRFDLSE